MKRLASIALVATVVAVGFGFRKTSPRGEGVAAPIFQLTGSAKILHFEGGATPGVGAFKTSVDSAAIAACIQGAAAGCSGATIETDPAGLAYLFCDSPTSWRIATNLAGTNATTLSGLLDGKGAFMFAGTHALSGTQFLLVGKAKLLEGTLTPTSVKATVYGVSTTVQHYATGKVSTVAQVN